MNEENRPSSTYKVVHATRKEKAKAWLIGILIGFCIGTSYGYYNWVM